MEYRTEIVFLLSELDSFAGVTNIIMKMLNFLNYFMVSTFNAIPETNCKPNF